MYHVLSARPYRTPRLFNWTLLHTMSFQEGATAHHIYFSLTAPACRSSTYLVYPLLVPWQFVACLSLGSLFLACPLAVCPLLVPLRVVPCLSLGGLSPACPLAVCPLLAPWRFVPCLPLGSLSLACPLAVCPSLVPSAVCPLLVP